MFVPLEVESVTQDGRPLVVILQLVLETTFTPAIPPAAATLAVDARVAESVGVVARGVILNVYLLSPPGVPSERLLLCPSYMSATKVVAPLAWRAAKEIDEAIAITSPVAEFLRHPTLVMLGTLTTSFLLDSVITILLGTSAPLN